jgi:hypothetical protein
MQALLASARRKPNATVAGGEPRIHADTCGESEPLNTTSVEGHPETFAGNVTGAGEGEGGRGGGGGMEGAGAGEQQFGPQWTLPLRKVRQSILRFRNEMIRYRDQVLRPCPCFRP